MLQSLAQHGLLTQFHYLSTVSGGGYIGSWLQAWRRQAGGLNAVVEGLNRRDPETGQEPPELTGLRENSAYLTPKRGVTSADAWTAVALYVRNLVLNWVVLGPVFLGVLTLPWLAYNLMAAVAQHGRPWVVCPLAALGSLALIAGLHSAAWQRRFAPPPGVGQQRFLGFVLLPMQLAASLFALATAARSAVPLSYAALWGAGLYLLAWGSAWLRANWLRFKQGVAELTAWPTVSNPVPPWLEAVFWIGCGAPAGVLVVLGFWVGGGDLRETVVVGVGCFMLAILAPEILYVGLASYANSGDDDREWLARSAGWLFASALVWMALATVVLYAGAVAGLAVTLSALAISLLAGGATAAVGSSIKTAASLAVNATSRLVPTSTGWLPSLGALLFIAALAVVLSILNARVLAWLSLRSPDFPSPPAQPLQDAGGDLLVIAALALFATGASFAVNVNRFSLHSVYRNRLIRGFLGSARREARQPVGSTAEPLHRLRPGRQCAAHRTMERSSASGGAAAVPRREHGAEPGRRQRSRLAGAQGGILHGNAVALWQPPRGIPADRRVRQDEERLVARHGDGDLRRGGQPEHGIPLVATGRIRHDTVQRAAGLVAGQSEGRGPHGPQRWPLLGRGRRAAGAVRPDHRSGTVRLPVRRRALREPRPLRDGAPALPLHFGQRGRQDPHSHFEDLGNAVRKIWIDLGVRIEFETLRIEGRATPARPGLDCAIARVDYRDPGSRPGLLVYLKPGFHGQEPPDIRSYANLHPEFPHESTANQWFTESQMEAYRALGTQTMDLICRGGRLRGTQADDMEHLSLGQLWKTVRTYVRNDLERRTCCRRYCPDRCAKSGSA